MDRFHLCLRGTGILKSAEGCRSQDVAGNNFVRPRCAIRHLFKQLIKY